MHSQRGVTDMGGTMRLGVYPCETIPDSWARKAYGEAVVEERHRHRWEVNNRYRERMEAVNLWPTGLSPDGELIEIMEYSPAKFMVGTQFHPEFLSRPNRPHPLFREFIGVATDVVREGGPAAAPRDRLAGIARTRAALGAWRSDPVSRLTKRESRSAKSLFPV